MTGAPTLTVLVATLGQRRDRLARLLRGLMPQVEAAAGRVRVLAFWDNGEIELAAKRQALVDACRTDYLCFVDDDDTVSDDYVAEILAALDSRPDFVGMWMRVYRDGEWWRDAELSLAHLGAGWFDGPTHYCRDVTHENPIRTDIAQRVDWRGHHRDSPEDSAWAAKLRPLLADARQVMIDRPLYNYWWVPASSAWGLRRRNRVIRNSDPTGQRWQPLHVRSPWFSWHPRSVFRKGFRMSELLVVVPSRSRPENVERLMRAWVDTDAFEVASCRIDIDADDPAFRDYMALADELPAGARLAVGHRWRSLVWKLNRAARQEQHGYLALGFMGDDHLPRTHQWAHRYLAELAEMGTGIVYGDDGFQHENTPTQWAMTTDIVRALGGRMVPAPVEHLYCDDAVRDLGRAAGCLRYLPDVLVEHMHPSAGKAQRDPQYVRVNSREQYAKDRPAYRRWVEHGLPGQAGEVVRLRVSAAPAESNAAG